MQELSGRTAVVTGAASGIGRAMAERFAKAGMRLALVDIEAEPLEAAAEALRGADVEVMSRVVDVSDGEAMEALRAATIERFGAVHVVCNNAGVATVGTAWELTQADWEFTLGPNLWGVIHGVRLFVPDLVAQDEGHVINTASEAGLVSPPHLAAYNVTKQAVVALSETLHADLAMAGSKVGVSVLCPNFVRTRIWDSERNRPAHLRNEEPAAPDPVREAGKQALRKVIEASMPVERIADVVHDAILEPKLYLLTHEQTRDSVRHRFEAILSGAAPDARPAIPDVEIP